MVQRHVERIEPDDRVGALMHVLVPGPGRREDQIALVHPTRLAVDDGGRARAFQHEAQRVHGVTVRARLLARQQHLEIGADGFRGLPPFVLVVARRDELQHPPLDRLRRGDLDGAGDQRTDVLPRPKVGRLGRRRRPVRELVLPQRRHVGVLPRLAKLVDLGGGLADAVMAVDLSRHVRAIDCTALEF